MPSLTGQTGPRTLKEIYWGVVYGVLGQRNDPATQLAANPICSIRFMSSRNDKTLSFSVRCGQFSSA